MNCWKVNKAQDTQVTKAKGGHEKINATLADPVKIMAGHRITGATNFSFFTLLRLADCL
jgi:hypothetical protein